MGNTQVEAALRWLPPEMEQELVSTYRRARIRSLHEAAAGLAVVSLLELLLAFRLEDGANYHNLPCSLSWENTTTGQSGQRRSRMGYASIMGRQLVRGQHGKRDVAAQERSPVRRGRRGSRWVKH